MSAPRKNRLRWLVASAALALFFSFPAIRAQAPSDSQPPARVLLSQSPEEARAKSVGCISCHTTTDSPTMHPTGTVQLGCADCHGGKSGVVLPAGTARVSATYDEL